jgi:FtsZ-binding cell division protein ZapB
MDSGILMIQDSILVCSPDPRIPHTATNRLAQELVDAVKETNRLAQESVNAVKQNNQLAKQSQTIAIAQHLGKDAMLEDLLASLSSSSG